MSANVPPGLDVTTTQNFHQVITVITVITVILTTKFHFLPQNLIKIFQMYRSPWLEVTAPVGQKVPPPVCSRSPPFPKETFLPLALSIKHQNHGPSSITIMSHLDVATSLSHAGLIQPVELLLLRNEVLLLLCYFLLQLQDLHPYR